MTVRVNTKRQILFFILMGIFCSTTLHALAAKKITQIQIDPADTNFKFDSIRIFKFESEETWRNFWAENTRNLDKIAPQVPVNWNSEALLAIFWASEDAIVRLPAFLHAEEIGDFGTPEMKTRLNFVLHRPCFGIITDESPAAFFLVDESLNNTQRIAVQTENSKAIGCF